MKTSTMKSGSTSWSGKLRELALRNGFKPYWTEKQAFGNSFHFWIGDAVGESWYTERNATSVVHFQSGIHELEFLFDVVLKPDDIIFECGAHHGWTTLQLSRFLTSGQVVAFEPNLFNFGILQKNLSENQCQNVRAEWTALSNKTGQSKMYSKSNGSVVPSLSGWNLFSKRLLNRVYGISSVPATSIDDFVKRSGVKPTVLKVDVEGFECLVFQGAVETLKQRPKLFVEIHTHQLALYGGSVAEILRIVNLQDYRVWLQKDGLKPPIEVSSLDISDIDDRVHLFAVPR